MKHCTLVKCCSATFIVLVVCFDSTLCLVPNNVDNGRDVSNSQNDAKLSSIWFGPRMGRKKHIQDFEDNKLSEILQTLDEYPWTKIAINENNDLEKRQTKTHNFTPRLGRTLEEMQAQDMEIIERSQLPFRLAKSNNNVYSPRLGRDDLSAYL